MVPVKSVKDVSEGNKSCNYFETVTFVQHVSLLAQEMPTDLKGGDYSMAGHLV